MLNKSWNVYARTGHMRLGLIKNAEDNRLIINCFTVWAIKPDCSRIKLDPADGGENEFIYDILSEEQVNLDFIDIAINAKNNADYICDKDKSITRSVLDLPPALPPCNANYLTEDGEK